MFRGSLIFNIGLRKLDSVPPSFDAWEPGSDDRCSLCGDRAYYLS